MRYSTTAKATLANCTVAWCAADDHEHDGPTHFTQSAPIEVVDQITGKPTVLYVEVEQGEDGATRISVTGAELDLLFSAADFERIARAGLAHIKTVESAK
ncbi:hypothetical protein ABZ912_42455 [Nonomuraea angiospora]|uniref:hypothetical protein n=1 Tax=Nonomuraea angiospora TaxID=46172 RepID=UPI0033DD2C33